MPIDHQVLSPVLQVKVSDLPHRALLVGDPARAEAAARLLEQPRLLGKNREYVTYRGVYAGAPVAVCSHGVGSAGASVCFTELARAGVRVLLRAGTCGALQKEIDDGSWLVGVAAVREDGTTDRLIPLAYPAYADSNLVLALNAAVKGRGRPVYCGVILTQSFLYPGLLPSGVELWSRAGVLGVEMEYAALLVVASLHGARAAGIFTTDGNLVRQDADLSPENYHPHREVVQRSVQDMLIVALEALTTASI